MKRATIAAMLLSLAAWLFPIHAASAELIHINQPQENLVNKEIKEPSNVQSTVPLPNSISIPTLRQTNKPRQGNGEVSRKIESGYGQYSGRHYSKEEVQALIISYSEQYGINPDVPLCIAKLESGYNHLAKNQSSSASGVFQYLANLTWKHTDEGKSGLSVFDAEANVRAAIKYMASRRSTKPWEVRNRCPKL